MVLDCPKSIEIAREMADSCYLNNTYTLVYTRSSLSMDMDPSVDSDVLRTCVYCGAPAVGQSMQQHVAQTVDADHGAFQTIPDDFHVTDCPRVDD